jgi:YHS domain-containing protein
MKLLLAATLCLAIGAAAQAENRPKMIKCAVQGYKISIDQATKDHMFADYKGRRYFFCCNGCPQEFKLHPAKYAKSESIPTPKKKGR